MTDDTDNIVNLNGKKPKRALTPKQQAHFDKLKADHVPTDGHAATGPGWGGPAKGAGQPYGVKGGKGGRPTKAISQMKAEERTELELELQELKLTIARTADNEMTRLSAINSIENRLLGMPKQTVDAKHEGGMTIQVLTGVPRAED